MTKSASYLLVAALALLPGSFGFDDLTGAAAVGGNNVPTPYQSLRFATFSVLAFNPTNNKLTPHSTPNYAGSGVRNQILQGTGPTIDFAYPGATLKSFDAKSLYYGCVLNAQSAVLLPIACTIQATGTKADTGATVGPQYLNFAPPAVAGTGISTGSSMAFAQLSGFTGLKSLSLVVQLSSIPAAQQATTNLMIDDFVHINYS
ncbi:MAG: hypothetical protein M1826_005721 [Phylliscum demangeonii]|nr:MAG: hypothetical protein M1826_005721 [Phylliscum demangeonii]